MVFANYQSTIIHKTFTIMALFYVSATDKLLSGWGEASGKTSKFVVACDTEDQYDKFKTLRIMKETTYEPLYGELIVLEEMFEKEVNARGIKFPEDNEEELRQECFSDFVQQYIDDQDTDPHINCLEGITCEKEISEIDWDEVYG